MDLNVGARCGENVYSVDCTVPPQCQSAELWAVLQAGDAAHRCAQDGELGQLTARHKWTKIGDGKIVETEIGQLCE